MPVRPLGLSPVAPSSSSDACRLQHREQPALAELRAHPEKEEPPRPSAWRSRQSIARIALGTGKTAYARLPHPASASLSPLGFPSRCLPNT